MAKTLLHRIYRMNEKLWLLAAMAILLIVTSCSSVRHVPDGQYLLNNIKLKINDSTHTLTEDEMQLYIRQQPNHKLLWSTKFQLGIYNMSGKDSTKWLNKLARKLGEAPVIYDQKLTDRSAQQLLKAMNNKGFYNARVQVDTMSKPGSKKMNVTYSLTAGQPHIIQNIDYDIADDSIKKIIDARLRRTLISQGDFLDMNNLELERERITNDLRNRGYYAFTKDLITFNADTTQGSNAVDLSVIVRKPDVGIKHNTGIELSPTDTYIVKDVYVVLNYDPVTMQGPAAYAATDTISIGHIHILSNGRPYLRPSVIAENIRITPGEVYNAREVTRTYQALGRLEILNFAGIRMVPVSEQGPIGFLDAYVLLTPGKPQSMTLELEATNSEGDLGVAAAIGYAHRNIGKGAESFSARLRGAYESLSGNLDGLLHDRYMEYSLSTSLNFPRFKAPFLSSAFKRNIMATTKVNFALTYQERPEYTRVIGAAGWSYIWSKRNGRQRHTWTPIDINYVYLPESTTDFIDLIAPDNPLLRYSYEDHFIMSMAYRFYITNKRNDSPYRRQQQHDVWTLRANVESAGNLLYLLNSMINHHEHPQENPYKVFGIRYSQYLKGEADFTFTHSFDRRQALAMHAGFGIAYPYGNSRMVPFEKRFYGGGASGVRGWDVRTLGPGSYNATNSVTSFINQCGDIKLDLSVEYRAKLFWVVELGLFIDAGNIWTIHNYENQPGGMFHFNSFIQQLALAYGLGIRLDFNYFLLRFDMGMKAHNPAEGQEPWPIIHPRWGRDSSFHFSIGYPF